MFSMSIKDTSRVIRMSDASALSVTYDHHSYHSRGVIHDLNIFIINPTVFMINEVEEKVL
jgi:hypothetical protein